MTWIHCKKEGTLPSGQRVGKSVINPPRQRMYLPMGAKTHFAYLLRWTPVVHLKTLPMGQRVGKVVHCWGRQRALLP